MRVRILRRVALCLIALLAYAQAAVAVAGCTMERAEMAQMAAHGCCELQLIEPGPLLDNVCVVHCTNDLQRFEPPAQFVSAPPPAPVLVIQDPGAAPPDSRHHAILPAAVVPARILFQSFLV